MIYMITDWDDLLYYVKNTPHTATVEYPVPTRGDIWVVEQTYLKMDEIKKARSLGIPVLVIGIDDRIEKELSTADIQFMGGSYFDPNDLLVWLETKKNFRPTISKRLNRGKMATFAGLLPTGGGVGKDTIVSNTACLLSKLGKHVVVVDLDPYGTLKERFKIESNFSVDLWKERFQDVETTRDKLLYAIPQTVFGFYVIPASVTGKVHDEETIKSMGYVLGKTFDVVLWNLGSGSVTKSFLSAIQNSESVFLVGCGERYKFNKFKEIYEQYEQEIDETPLLLLNKVYRKEIVSFFQKTQNINVFSYASYDLRYYELSERGRSIVLDLPKADFSLMIQKIAGKIIKEDEISLTPIDKKVDKAKKNPFRLF